MATLYERLTGVGLDRSGDDGGGKINPHAFLAAVSEYRRNFLTEDDVRRMFDLTDQQVADSRAFFHLLGLAPDPTAMRNMVKEWIYLAEEQCDSRYDTAAAMFARMQQEVLDQGGTLS